MPRRKNKKHKSPDSLVSSRKSKGIKCCWNTISKGAIKWMKLKKQWGQISYILLGNCRSFGSYSEFNRNPKEVWAEGWWDLNYALKRLSSYSCVENELYWSKSGKEYVKAIYCHPTYLTYMQNTSCKIPGWMKHKLEKDFREKYQ